MEVCQPRQSRQRRNGHDGAPADPDDDEEPQREHEVPQRDRHRGLLVGS